MSGELLEACQPTTRSRPGEVHFASSDSHGDEPHRNLSQEELPGCATSQDLARDLATGSSSVHTVSAISWLASITISWLVYLTTLFYLSEPCQSHPLSCELFRRHRLVQIWRLSLPATARSTTRMFSAVGAISESLSPSSFIVFQINQHRLHDTCKDKPLNNKKVWRILETCDSRLIGFLSFFFPCWNNET